MKLTVSHAFLPKHNSVRASQVMDHFGVGFEQGRHVIADDLELPIESGDVVLFTGASGSGKSSLLRAAADALASEPGGNAIACGSPLNGGSRATNSERACRVIDIDSIDLGEEILIDGLHAPAADAMHALSACGLGEAQLMLRTPAELSDGQRYRYRLARGLAEQADWLIADEFTATLDRTLARVIAFNVRRLADRTGRGFLLATTHEDIAGDLHPDVHVQCRLDGEVVVSSPGRDNESASDETIPHSSSEAQPGRVKKKRSRLARNCGSARRPSATGRISLGGITAAITSG